MLPAEQAYFASAIEDRHAKSGAGADDADNAFFGKPVRAADRLQLGRLKFGHRISHGAEIVEKGELFQAKLLGDRESGDSPIAVQKAQFIAFDRGGDGDRSLIRQLLAEFAGERGPRGAEAGMLAGPVAIHRADPRPRSRSQLGEG